MRVWGSEAFSSSSNDWQLKEAGSEEQEATRLSEDRGTSAADSYINLLSFLHTLSLRCVYTLFSTLSELWPQNTCSLFCQVGLMVRNPQQILARWASWHVPGILCSDQAVAPQPEKTYCSLGQFQYTTLGYEGHPLGTVIMARRCHVTCHRIMSLCSTFLFLSLSQELHRLTA